MTPPKNLQERANEYWFNGLSAHYKRPEEALSNFACQELQALRDKCEEYFKEANEDERCVLGWCIEKIIEKLK